MKLNNLYILLICLFTLACQPQHKEVSKLTEKPKVNLEKFQYILDSIYSNNPESVGILAHIESQENGISWSGSAGFSDKNKTALDPEQPALIASSIKTYIAASILKLQEAGKLNIEDKISKYLSKETIDVFTSDGYNFEEIKIKHLLSHTSGIEDYANDEYLDRIDSNPKYRWTRNEQLKLAIELGDPLGAAQDLFSYADANFLLCTEIIEQVYQKPFYTSISELLEYEKLGLNSTWFPTLEKKPEYSLNLVHQYWGKRNWDSYEHDISWDLYGGGGIATNTKELAQFSYHLFNNNIIQNEDILELIHQKIETKNGVDNHYGLGLSIGEVNGIQTYGHGGFWGTVVLYFPQLNTSIAVFILEKDKGALRRTIQEAFSKELTKQLKPLEITSKEAYTLYQAKNSKATLVLYPGGGTDAGYTKQEFNILTAAATNDISVLMMNFNRHIWIEDSTAIKLGKELEECITQHKLDAKKVFIGGMSIGGNVALALSNQLVKSKSKIQPHGVFIIDSPIDLNLLYQNAQEDVANPNFDENRLAEPRFIINFFEQEFGQNLFTQNILKASPFSLDSNVNSVQNLKNIRLRFYTEPDSLWWQENRQTNYKNTNAARIIAITEQLHNNDWKNLELVISKNKGYRSNGERHPHSWSIVDIKDLIEWIKE